MLNRNLSKPRDTQLWSPNVLAFAIVTLTTAKPAEHITRLGWEKCAHSPRSPGSTRNNAAKSQAQGGGSCRLAGWIVYRWRFVAGLSTTSRCLTASRFPPHFSAPELVGEAVWRTRVMQWEVVSAYKIFMSGRKRKITFLAEYSANFISWVSASCSRRSLLWAVLFVGGGTASPGREAGLGAPAAWTQALVWAPYAGNHDAEVKAQELQRLWLAPRGTVYLCDSKWRNAKT